MSRRPLIAGNWKMNLGPSSATALAHALRSRFADEGEVEVVVFPSPLSLAPVVDVLSHTGIGVGIQHFRPEPKGAFTGESALCMAQEVGAEWGLIGHSERRSLFGMTDEDCRRALEATLRESQLKPMLCLGERLEQREQHVTEQVLTQQLEGAVSGLSADEMLRVVIAYEPVWAIGTGLTASPAQAQEVHAMLRSVLAARFGQGVASAIRILYGGSVKPNNVDGLMICPDVDGALVGGAALDAESFARIVRFNRV